MINLKPRTRLAIFVAGAILVIVLGYWLYYWTQFVRPMNIFRAQEIESIQYFDELNMDILSELPVPTERMRLISKGTSGILSPTNVHGRILVIRYEIVNDTDASISDLLNLYESRLSEKGWKENGETTIDDYYSLTYSYGTSCVKLVVLYKTREFGLEIWHDFLSQKFSPSLPPSELLYNWDMGKTEIVTCP